MPIRNSGIKTLLECGDMNGQQGVTSSFFAIFGNNWHLVSSCIQCNRLSASLECMIKSGIIKDSETLKKKK